MFRRDMDHFGSFGDHGFGGRLRAARGMIEPAILQVLLDKPMHGYEIIATLEERSQGMWRPSAGSVYPTLQLLEEKEYLTSKEQTGKKVYTLTDSGRAAANEAKDHYSSDAWKDRIKALGGMHHFRHELGDIMKIIRIIMKKGTDDQKDQLKLEIMRFKNSLEDIAKEGN